MDFGAELVRLRRQARLSQAAVAGAAGLSQRHLSFLETGRARPGARALAQLIDGMALLPSDAAHLLAAAGLQAPRAPLAWAAPGLAEVRGVLARLLAQLEPWPAFVQTRAADVLLTNAGLDRLLAIADAGIWPATCGAGARNLADLTLHPAGLMRWLANPAAVVPPLLRRLRRAAAAGDAGAAATLVRVARHPATRAFGGLAETGTPANGVISEDYRFGALTLRFLAMSASFGNPADATTEALTIETLLPADAATTSILAALRDGTLSIPPPK